MREKNNRWPDEKRHGQPGNPTPDERKTTLESNSDTYFSSSIANLNPDAIGGGMVGKCPVDQHSLVDQIFRADSLCQQLPLLRNGGDDESLLQCFNDRRHGGDDESTMAEEKVKVLNRCLRLVEKMMHSRRRRKGDDDEDDAELELFEDLKGMNGEDASASFDQKLLVLGNIHNAIFRSLLRYQLSLCSAMSFDARDSDIMHLSQLKCNSSRFSNPRMKAKACSFPIPSSPTLDFPFAGVDITKIINRDSSVAESSGGLVSIKITSIRKTISTCNLCLVSLLDHVFHEEDLL
ncbi:hypothetical protein L6452_30764 [Arctium lappa]|uniref:Uncharacterized protein n=1 Tax=Arctium lappa TaxID=4217 RepID=A0ACB8ZK92_ARCLA|nr:hypothetical protein L6452_30764 [Arctium lappa]